MLIYYYKTRQFKNFVDIKLKFIFNLLYDNNIKVLDPLLNNLFLNKNNEDYIIDFIIKNLKTIIANEISEYVYRMESCFFKLFACSRINR